MDIGFIFWLLMLLALIFHIGGYWGPCAGAPTFRGSTGYGFEVLLFLQLAKFWLHASRLTGRNFPSALRVDERTRILAEVDILAFVSWEKVLPR
jgi:hypothetical protein